MTSIITGATSFIGLALTRKLLSVGENIIAIIRPNSLRKSCLPLSERITIIESELSNLDTICIDGQNIDTFYHIGWSSDFDNPRYNLSGQLLNVEYGKKAFDLAVRLNCNTFLSIGSQAECGRINGCITPFTPAKPETAYAVAKVVLNEKLKGLCEDKGIKFCSPRLLSGYGPYDRPGTMIMSCIAAGLNNVPFNTTPASQIWDYIYVDDIADALYCIAKKGQHAKRYPIGSGIGKSLMSYILTIAELTGSKALLSGIGNTHYVENQVMNLLADISELQNDTSFYCKTDFNSGIRKTIDYLLSKDI